MAALTSLSAQQVADRCAWFTVNSDNDSVQVCVQEALKCLRHHDFGHRHPNAEGGRGILPTTWLDSATYWLYRANQHEFGFNVPFNMIIEENKS